MSVKGRHSWRGDLGHRDLIGTTRGLTSRRGRPLVATAVVVLVLALGVGTAMAAVTGSLSSAVFHACLKNGTLSKVGTTARACGSGSSAVSWNQTGPKGARGPRGKQGTPGTPGGPGPAGPSNSFYLSETGEHIPATLGSVGALLLAAGTYVVNADLSLQDISASHASDLVECQLILGTASDAVDVGVLGSTSSPENFAAMSLTVAGTITAAGVAEVKCVGAGNTGNTLANTVSITAVQSASLDVQS